MCDFCGAKGLDHIIATNIKAITVCPNCIAEKTYYKEWDEIFEKCQNITGQTSEIFGYDPSATMIKFRPMGDLKDRSYSLTLDEFKRLVGHSLMPNEFKELTKHYASYEEYAFDLHEDFYDDEGFALQPIDEDLYYKDLKKYMKVEQAKVGELKGFLKELKHFMEYEGKE